MFFKKSTSFLTVMLTLAVLIVGCTESHVTHSLVENDASKGELVWSETLEGWELQCPNSNDHTDWDGMTTSDIEKSEDALNWCLWAAANLAIPDPFDTSLAELEIQTFVDAVPKYKDCFSDFAYRMGTEVVLEAERRIESSKDAASSFDEYKLSGGAETTRRKNAGSYLQLSYEAATGARGKLCNEIQF